jgi:hypothetical protein
VRWFFGALYGTAGVMLLAFVGWVVTRMLHLEAANHFLSRLLVWDLYAVGVVIAYAAFVGGWHLWEKLTGRMEPTETERRSLG